MLIANLLIGLYCIILVGVALYSFNALILSVFFLRHRRNKPQSPQVTDWPAVTVQLPIYNERLVIERLIDAVAALDYPSDRLSIQVLDDSTDETVSLARARVVRHQLRGINIAYVRRADRVGYKAGALAYGLESAPGEFIAIFDADFVPEPDFLRQVIPHFAGPQVGAVQARWGHLNAEYDSLTRAQALALDGHFMIEQTGRSQTGLFFNFNGSGGVWRRTCIEQAGGWQDDTIAEDLDLSYRAQLAGWQLRYLRDVIAPAEVPPLLVAFKRQQFRWAKGSIQCLRKFTPTLLQARLSPWRKIQAFLHLSAYLIHPLILAMILIGLPVILLRDPGTFPLSALGLAGFAPPLLFALSQWAAYPDWLRRFAYFPFLVFLSTGVTLNNSQAVFEALSGRNARVFLRTPKFRSVSSQPGDLYSAGDYRLPVDWTTWGELVLVLFCVVEAVVAFTRAPGLVPFLIMYALGYAYTAVLGLRQSRQRRAFVGQTRHGEAT
jgi:cellulose synthase/poly-beta-1,6-N-acetylglucosamine synthase-like glycosyltransferase